MLLPSYSEGLPYALLEAMAVGIPVIATPVGAIPDVLTDGTHGLLVPPRDGKAIAEALARLAGDRERLSWMSRACRRRVRAAFSIERLSQELSLHYAQLCGKAVMAGPGRPAPAWRQWAIAAAAAHPRETREAHGRLTCAESPARSRASTAASAA